MLFDADDYIEIIRHTGTFLSIFSFITLLFFIVFRRNNIKGKIDVNNKVFEFSQEKIMEVQNEHINNSLSEHKSLPKFKGQPTENIIQHYDSVKYNDSITNWIAYKEGVQIISSATLKIAYRIREFITSNGLGGKSELELEELAKKRANDIIGLYNLELKKSDMKVVNELTIKKICGTYFYIIEMLLYRCYKDIGINHINCIETMKEKETLYYKVNGKLSVKDKMSAITKIRHAEIHKMNCADDKISEQTLTQVQNIIIGIFHDMLVKE